MIRLLTYLIIASRVDGKMPPSREEAPRSIRFEQGGMVTGIQKQHCMRWTRLPNYDHQETVKGIQLER
jgi:hypothetical protein